MGWWMGYGNGHVAAATSTGGWVDGPSGWTAVRGRGGGKGKGKGGGKGRGAGGGRGAAAATAGSQPKGAKRARPEPQEPTEPPEPPELRPDDWPVPPARRVADIEVGGRGVAFATPAEVVEAQRTLGGKGGAIAVLTAARQRSLRPEAPTCFTSLAGTVPAS
eukprot:gene17285-12413_t